MFKFWKSIVGLALFLSCNCSHSPTMVPLSLPSKSQNFVMADKPLQLIVNDTTDPKHPTIILFGEINDTSASDFISALFVDKINGAQSVTIKINSPGGIVEDGFAMVQAMSDVDMPTYCIVDGDASSMAFYLLENCTDRAATPRSGLLAHEPRFSDLKGPQTRYGLRELANQLDTMSDIMNSVEAQRMGLPLNKFEEMVANKDLSMNADKACKMHAIDKIVDPKGKLIKTCH